MTYLRIILAKQMKAAALWGAVAILGTSGAAYAGSLTISGSSTTDIWTAETGQNIPTGTAGFVGGTLTLNGGGLVRFTNGGYTTGFGGSPLLVGETGHGDSTFPNEFWVGTGTRAQAVAAGDVICTQAGMADCNGSVTPVGYSFDITLSAGAIPFHFVFGPNTTNTLDNGTSNNSVGAYLAQVGLGTTAFGGPGLIGYLGLSDNTYPTADHDFQDMSITVSTTPEPASLALLGVSLLGLGYLRRRRNSVR